MRLDGLDEGRGEGTELAAEGGNIAAVCLHRETVLREQVRGVLPGINDLRNTRNTNAIALYSRQLWQNWESLA